MAAELTIPVIDMSGFGKGGDHASLGETIVATAAGLGFMVVTGLDIDVDINGPLARDLLAIFTLPEAEKRRIARKKYVPENPWIYRGYFLADAAQTAFKEGIDVGVHAASWPASEDPLRECGPLPDEALLPRFKPAMAAWTGAMERLGERLLRILAEGAGLRSETYAQAFSKGASTFRLLHYPVRTEMGGGAPPNLREHHGKARMVGTGEHTDSGGLTLLVQDRVGGLQVLAMDGETWLDVPPIPNSVVVNLGDLMQVWSGGRYRATPHRVLSPGVERYSIPYFYEPRYDAVITPPDGESFTYRAHIVKKMAGFTEFKGVGVG